MGLGASRTGAAGSEGLGDAMAAVDEIARGAGVALFAQETLVGGGPWRVRDACLGGAGLKQQLLQQTHERWHNRCVGRGGKPR